MISSPGWSPWVSMSSFEKFGGHAGHQLLVLDALLEHVPPLAHHRRDVAHLRAATLLADLEHLLLGLVDRLGTGVVLSNPRRLTLPPASMRRRRSACAMTMSA